MSSHLPGTEGLYEQFRRRTFRCDDEDATTMPQRTTLDAMIPREDFGIQSEDIAIELFEKFPISYLASDDPRLTLLRKPDFQRETNHWTPEQVVTLLLSFIDGEVIPSLILWRSPSFIFVIDGGHRLSAMRAWMEDDYGDGPISQAFYHGEIPEEQKKIAKRTRRLVEGQIGRFQTLRALVGNKTATDQQKRRTSVLFTRAIPVQWIQGSATHAETSFFKINSQGTPLDETEELLIRNRRKAVAISARAILRAGAGHEYWSSFDEPRRHKVKELAACIANGSWESACVSPSDSSGRLILPEPEGVTPCRDSLS